LKLHQPSTLAEIIKILKTTGATSRGVELMKKKALGLAIELGEFSPSLGNIIKQEALAVGADAAVHEKTSRCEVEKTKVVLVGTLKQLEDLAKKLQKNVAGLPKIGKDLEKILNKKFKS
jgi:dihydropteroate synthase